MKLFTILVAATMLAAGSYAETFGTGANQFTIDFVNIGHAGNVADSTGYGAVGYDYRMGKYEITIDQFSKARAVDNRISNGNEIYWNDGIRTVGLNAPAGKANWFEAAKFANWLTSGDAHTGVYQFNNTGEMVGLDRSYRNGMGNAYVLPSKDEWHKAAYYKPIDDGSYSLYASGLNTSPIHGTSSGWNYNHTTAGLVNDEPNSTWTVGFGGEEQNGTYDMMGNVYEWNESAFDGTLDVMDETRWMSGGNFFNYEDVLRSTHFPGGINFPTIDYSSVGIRIVAIPEPSSAILMLAVGGGWLARRRFVR